MSQHIVEETVKAVLPITISTIYLFGIPLDQWVLILTIIYTVLLIISTLRDKFITPYLEKKKREMSKANGDHHVT